MLPCPGNARSRSGSYAVIVAFALIVIIGMGALAVDAAYLRLAQSQAQDVADAASQAAVFVLRRTGDLDEAEAAAQATIDRNPVVGVSVTLDEIEFGTWDDSTTPGSFTATEDGPNAVRATVSRSGGDGVPFLLARVLGYDKADVVAEATSASRSLNVCLAMDITNSWSRSNFYNAKDASVAFLDTMSLSYGELDQIGMTVFTGRYAWEFTPMTYIEDEVDSGAVRAEWDAMETASKAGQSRSYPKSCKLHKAKWYARKDDFSSPAGGCYANMPREYTDEPGTDHTTGIELCETMFSEMTDPTAYRAMVVLTDGIPNGISSGHGAIRSAAGYSESRWREHQGPAPHSTSDIKADAVDLTEDMWADMEVHTWVVSFVKDDPFMHQMPRGDGYFKLTSNSAELVTIFEDIANSMPIAIVE